MFTVEASLRTECPDLDIAVVETRPATTSHPPQVTLCLRNVGNSTHFVAGGGSMPLSRYAARDAEQPRRIVVYPTRTADSSTVVPDAPTDGTWAMAEAFTDSMHAITARLDPGTDLCEEYAILTYRPYHDGYPPGRYVATDDLRVDESRDDDGVPARVEVVVVVESADGR